MQYANFMPGEWLPWEDHGYLQSVYTYGQEIGVGLGSPDLMVQRRGQLNHAFAKDFLNVKYMFWVDQEPYFSEDVIPCFKNK